MPYDENGVWYNDDETGPPPNPNATGASKAINDQNPNADPAKKYVQGGNTGGYLEGVGETIKEGSSLTRAQADAYYTDAVGKYGQARADQFLRDNPDDYQRLHLLSEYEQGGNGGQDADDATSQYSGSRGADGDAALQALLQMLTQQQQQQQQERASIREILMAQLGELQQPLSANSPGIREAISANRLGLQRGTEQSRREIAERRAYDESGGVGSKGYQTDVDRLLQQRGEAGAQFEGQIMHQELTNRANRLQQLLSTALNVGDAESARNLQAQLAAIQQQLQQGRFYDDMGYRYSALQSQLNGQAANALLY